ncbi:MAG TPA: cupredoxin domain-containing protein [Candidatus Dormibacteraeota bacterium]|nr:cupredoxin domain-containing protein [Candidatus Dormibacteraeota bacterium]
MRRVQALSAMALLAVGLAACGSTYSPPGAGAGAPSGALALTTQDFQYTPTSLTVAAGQPVTFTITNHGPHEHNFSITSLKIDQDVANGKTESVTFTPSAAGPAVLQFFCSYHFKTNGMGGSITVTGASGAPETPGATTASPAPAASASAQYHY